MVLECTFDYPPEAAHRELAGTRVMFGYGPGGRLGAIALPPGEGSVTLFPDGDGPRPSATWETLELRAAEGELRYLAFRYRVVGTRLEVEGETAVGACVLGAPP